MTTATAAQAVRSMPLYGVRLQARITALLDQRMADQP